MKKLLTITAIIEGATGLGLLVVCFPGHEIVQRLPSFGCIAWLGVVRQRRDFSAKYIHRDRRRSLTRMYTASRRR
jgi:hypothetical protein